MDGWKKEEKKESLWFGCVQGKVNKVKELLLFFFSKTNKKEETLQN